MFSVNFSKVVGAASEKRWSQVHSFVPSEEKIYSSGVLFMAVGLDTFTVEDEAEFDLASIGKELVQRFHEYYFGSEKKPKSPLKHLEDSVEQIAAEFDSVCKELIAGVLFPVETTGRLGILYLVTMGPASAFLMRNERLYRLVGGKSDSSESSDLLSMSGFIGDKDILVLGTKDFYELVSVETLKSALSSGDSVEASSILAPHVHGSESSGVAAVIALVRKSEKTSRRLYVPEQEEISVAQNRDGVKDLKVGISGFVARTFGSLVSLRSLLGKLKGGSASDSKVREHGIVVREGVSRQRRLMLSVAMVILVLLGVSITLGWRQRLKEGQEERFMAVWEVADHQYNEAVSLAELNPLRARALLVEAKKMIDESLSDSKKELSRQHREQLGQRLEEISNILEEVSGEHRIEEASIFMDLNLVRPDTFGEVLALHEDTLVVLDRSSNVLLRISVSKKSSEAAGGGSLLAGSKIATVYSGRGFVVSESGVVEVSLSNKTSAVVIENDPEWGMVVDIKAFAGNLYLLDSGTQEIFRYQGAEGGFGERRRWLGEGVFPDLSKAVSIAIDGDIWVLTDDEILKFRRGAPESFTMGGLDVALEDLVSLYTDEESERVYVLDRGNKRVLILDKSGEYRAQYLWDGIEAVTDMIVSEKEGKILLLSGSIIYEIGLQE